ncbi:hypothetical protein [Belliella aquatica]|uniref:DUF4878 domain-containing protein n=1 Tax=Belliella aquatica TaxID=1323734 RepID=A0ABQ1M3T1_9BACT|nr:hypothetical protein [Belliella aquatica]MCH7406840.1 hypothetical protein [Belliella aquatica]GGC32285.1 hypothetical protein GCM10010993_09120 [Belliella aquatica]
MKSKIIIIVIAFLAFSACKSGPEKAAKNFTENLFTGKIEEAKKYATESTVFMLDLGLSTGAIPIDPNFKFKMVKDSIVQKQAWVTFIDHKGNKDKLMLVKIDSKWLVHLDFSM